MKKSWMIKSLFFIVIILFTGCNISITNSVTLEDNYLNDSEASNELPTETDLKVDTLYEVIQNNGNCSYPCFWGIMPGRDSINQIKSSFEKYGEIIELGRTGNNYDIVIFEFDLPDEIEESVSKTVDIDFRTKNQVVETIHLCNEVSLYLFPDLSSILNHFGKPNEIWIDVAPNIDDYYYSISLFYSDIHTLVSWNGTTQLKEFDDSSATFSICPQNINKEIDYIQYYPTSLFFWSLDREYTFNELYENYLKIENTMVQLSAHNSNIDIENFYEIYSDENDAQCFNYIFTAEEKE
jgi:hypothetical protein